MAPAFRLGQTFNPALQRDALEELYLNRDPATLDTLFSWVWDRPRPFIADAQTQLTAIGDWKGDVYNRAFQFSQRLSPPQDGQTWWNPAQEMQQIMAQTDPHRALAEFRRESQSSDPKVKKSAFWEADFCGTQEALDLGFDLLKNPQTVDDGHHDSAGDALPRHPIVAALFFRGQVGGIAGVCASTSNNRAQLSGPDRFAERIGVGFQ